jgi:LacI family transcriptional regulator
MDKGKRKPVSQIEIARIAGVSRTTVSFVLNNVRGKNISEETRQRVVAAAREFGYTPDEAAVDTATSRDGAISLFVAHSDSVFSDAYILRLLEGMGPVLNKARRGLRVVQFRVSRNDYLETARRNGYEGVLLLNTHVDDPGIAPLEESGLPFVVIGSLPDARLAQVDIDNAEAARKVGEYLLSLGHRDIAVVAHAPEAFLAVRARLQGFLGALRDAGIELPPERIAFAHFTEESGYAATKSLLERGQARSGARSERPTALFATNDMVAYGALRALDEAGLAVPEDVSVAGFDDDYMSRYTNPPLTTMTLPAEGIGRIAAESLLWALDGKPPRAGTRLLPTSLTIRRSCRDLNRR